MPARVTARDTATGTIRVFVAEALIFPTGLITSAILTRELGTEDYGLISLAGMLVAWVEWSLVSLFARATVRLVSQSEDWKPLGARMLHLSLALGITGAAALWLLAPWLSNLLDTPRLVAPLRLFAVDVPVFSLAFAHRAVLTGLGEFGLRAWAIATRWVARLALVLVMMAVGLSVRGAILATVGATIFELLVATRYDRPRFFARARLPARTFLEYAMPLFFAALARRVYQEIDLFALKALGGTVAQAGLYAAARNLSVVPGVFAGAFSPVLLTTLVQLVHGGATERANGMARDGLRLILLLLPFAGVAAGTSEAIVRLAFGEAFRPAAPLLTRLIFAGWGAIMITIAMTTLIAADRRHWPIAIVGPLAPLAVAAHWFVIPRWGPVGAATVTMCASLVGATASLLAAGRAWPIGRLWITALRSLAVTAAAWAVAEAWSAAGPMVVVKLIVLCAAVPLAFLALREIGAREITLARSLVPRRGRKSSGG